MDILIEHVAALVYLLAMYLKVLTSIVSENKVSFIHSSYLFNFIVSKVLLTSIYS